MSCTTLLVIGEHSDFKLLRKLRFGAKYCVFNV